MNPGVSTSLFEYFQKGQLLSGRELALIKKSGINDIEILAREYVFDYRNSDYVNAMVKKIRTMEINVSSVHAPFGTAVERNIFCDISAADEIQRGTAVKNMEKSVDAAIALGSDALVVHPGGETSPGDREFRTRQAKKSLGEILEYCRGKKIKISLENMLPSYVGDSCKEALAIAAGFGNEQLGICLDTGHAHINGEDLVAAVKLIGTKLLSLHVHDNNGKEDAHRAPFDGTIDWFAFRKTLEKTGFDGIFMYELDGELLLKKDPVNVLKKVKETHGVIFS